MVVCVDDEEIEIPIRAFPARAILNIDGKKRPDMGSVHFSLSIPISVYTQFTFARTQTCSTSARCRPATRPSRKSCECATTEHSMPSSQSNTRATCRSSLSLPLASFRPILTNLSKYKHKRTSKRTSASAFTCAIINHKRVTYRLVLGGLVHQAGRCLRGEDMR